MITRHQWAQRRNGACEHGLMVSRCTRCAWQAHLRSMRADILLDPRGTSRALRCIGSHNFYLARFHSTPILLGRVLARSGVVRRLLFPHPFLRNSALCFCGSSFLFFLSFSFLFHMHQQCRFRRGRARASFSSSRSPRPTTVQRPLQIARIALSDPESCAWHRTAPRTEHFSPSSSPPLAPGTTRVGE
ncbi:hypothetical protein BJY52DRAFT_408021 [Lactarius psammicola]|nr:hypothetical protein BJY52DRAFT_408021 [Lactarius psammicola]